MALDERRRFIRRPALLTAAAVLGALILFGLASVVVPGLARPACGCASPASIGPATPTPPVSLARAQTTAAAFTGVEMTSSGDWLDMGNRKVADLTGSNARAIVDGFSGEVLLAVKTNALPDGSEGSVTREAAARAATSYLDSVGIAGPTLSAKTTKLDAVPGVFEVDLSGANRTYRVFVNAVSGVAFAFAQGGLDRSSVPLISETVAARLARQALPEDGDVVINAELQLMVDTHPVWTWQIGLGIALPSDFYTGGGYVEVNASTGMASVMKDAR